MSLPALSLKTKKEERKKKRKEKREKKLRHILLSTVEGMNESRKDSGSVPESPIIASAIPGQKFCSVFVFYFPSRENDSLHCSE